MTLTRKLLTLSAITALSLSLTACGDDGDNSDNNPSNPSNSGQTVDEGAACTVSECKTATLLAKCDGGKLTSVNCSANGMVCKDAACVPGSSDPNEGNNTACTENDLKCDGKNLMVCTSSAWTIKEACTVSCDSTNKKCSEEAQQQNGGECLEASFTGTCPTSTTYMFCDNGTIKTETCPNNQQCKSDGKCEDICTNGEKRCSAKGVETCNTNIWSLTEECKDATPVCNAAAGKCEAAAAVVDDDKSIVGRTCACPDTEPDCFITITGTELKNAIAADAISQLAPLLTLAALDPKLAGLANLNLQAIIDGLNDNIQITAPNFFSSKVTGCDGLSVDGMSTGCLHDTTIKFEGLSDLVKDIFTVLEGMNLLTADMKTIIDGILKDGIPFKAKDGYCLTAAIDIVGDNSKSGLIPLIAPKLISADSDSLVNKINTGDHEKAQKASCPDGAIHFSYTVNYDDTDKGIMAAGKVDVGFDMCLRACNEDTDCREGYTCYAIPNGVPGEGQTSADLPTQKACFDAETIQYFTNMTNSFSSKE